MDGASQIGTAVAVLVTTEWGIPLVRDTKKPVPVFWKLPGGKGEYEDNGIPERSALRELTEETGIKVSMSDLKLVAREDRHNHSFFVFHADVSAEVLLDIKPQGDEGEEIEVFSREDVVSMKDFFPPHRRFVEKILQGI